MPSSRRKSTWAILSPSKLLPGSKALDLLGCVVADINNPTDYYRPKNIQATLQSLHSAITVEEEDVEIVLSSLYSAGVGLRLTQILKGGREQTDDSSSALQAHTVVTRYLEQHPDVVKTLDENHRAEILELLATKQGRKGRGFLVVGVKTCLDAKLVDVGRLSKSQDAGIEVPVDVILAASGVAIPGAGMVLNTGIEGHRAQVKSALTKHTVKGERVFAIQYAQVMRHQDWLHFSEPTLKHGGLQEIPVDRAMYGYMDDEDDGDNGIVEYDGVEPEDDALEVGTGLGSPEQSDYNDDMLLADL